MSRQRCSRDTPLAAGWACGATGIVMFGDTGEGDESQYAVVPPLLTVSQYWDSDDPPLFKSFLRLDVREGELRLRCFAATGCAEHEADPPVEDELSIPLA